MVFTFAESIRQWNIINSNDTSVWSTRDTFKSNLYDNQKSAV